MKGTFTKAFSLALLISVVPAFSMEKAKDMYNYVANSRVAGAASTAAGYVGSALVAPFDYTLGLAANKSGLANYVSNVDFVKNDTFYNATIGGGVKTVARYALGLALVYGGCKAVKAAYNWATKPAAAAKTEYISQEHEAVVKALEVVLNKVMLNKSKVAASQEMAALSKLPYMQECVVVKTGTGAVKSKVKTYADTVLGHVVGIDNASNAADREARVLAFTNAIVVIENNVSVYYRNAAQKKAVTIPAQEKKSETESKASTEQNPSRWTQAYNALVNRRTLMGAATVAGLGLVGYKYYNRAK